MPYTPPKFPSEIPTYDDVWPHQDDIDWMTVDKWDALIKELRACLLELGTLPKGSFADVKTRLDALNSDEVLGITIDGAGSVITTGLKGFREVPFDCEIMSWTILANVAGSIIIDVWKDTYNNFPPTVADSIAGTEKPTLDADQKNKDVDLSTWTKEVTAGDILAFNVDSVDTVTRVHLFLHVRKT